MNSSILAAQQYKAILKEGWKDTHLCKIILRAFQNKNGRKTKTEEDGRDL